MKTRSREYDSKTTSPIDRKKIKLDTDVIASSWIPSLSNDEYKQLLIWPGTEFDRHKDVDQLNNFMKTVFGLTNDIVVVGTIRTLPGQDGPGGRSDLFWLVHEDDTLKFGNSKRLGMGIRWWEDVFYNNGQDIYPADFKTAYPPLC
jgi:hypothetical protein